MANPFKIARIGAAALLALACFACGPSATPEKSPETSAARISAPALAATLPATLPASPTTAVASVTAETAPPPAQTGGFDGAAAYAQVAKLVGFGPHPPDTDAIRAVQRYIREQLASFGCAVETDDFHAETPIGSLAMQNVLAKVPGTGPGVILLLTHYDTLRLNGFVGAEDAGSSTGLMLEVARDLCRAPKRESAVWIAFLDGEENQRDVASAEEAQHTWNPGENTFGSRELAARLAVSGDLKRLRAVILADMIGQYNLHILREQDSTKWLKDVVWNTAARLGYDQIFLSQESTVSDDHDPFLQRGVPAIDIIDLDDYIKEGYWHSRQDTLDKVSPRSLAIVGHVIVESVAELQARK